MFFQNFFQTQLNSRLASTHQEEQTRRYEPPALPYSNEPLLLIQKLLKFHNYIGRIIERINSGVNSVDFFVLLDFYKQ